MTDDDEPALLRRAAAGDPRAVASRDLSDLTLTRFVNGRMQVVEQVSSAAPEPVSRLIESLAVAARAPRNAR